MEADKLSYEELEARVSELETQLVHERELMNKVREHKHNCAEDFGLVVSVPVVALLKELIVNPDAFSVEEKTRIIELQTASMELRGFYESLGLSIGNQLTKLKSIQIDKIRRNAIFFSSLVGKNVEFKDRLLLRKLSMALTETESLCKRLGDIENFDYGPSECFNLVDELNETFQKDRNASALTGNQAIMIETSFGDYSSVKVDMYRKGFRDHFLRNIIKNLHDHAFKRIEKETLEELTNINKTTIPRFPILALVKNKVGLGTDPYKESTMPVLFNKVRISLDQVEGEEKRIYLIIENNGHAFHGDINKVFENNYGEGTGIGLYSAKQFLNAYGATIQMITNDNSEYKVGFIINLPIV